MPSDFIGFLNSLPMIPEWATPFTDVAFFIVMFGFVVTAISRSK